MTDEATFEARRTSFGAGAATYDAVRPRWPEETVRWLLGSPDLALRVVDLGAGTGLGTRTAAGLGHEVVAVEPSHEMVAALREAAARLPDATSGRITALEAPAERLALRDASVDAVTCFQAWHWFDHARVASECARVLRPGGSLGLAWNLWSAELDWVRRLADVVGTPEMLWDPARGESGIDTPGVAGFTGPERTQFRLDQQLTADELVLLASSWSPVAVRADRDEVLTRVREIGERAADAGGRLTFSYVSDCYRFRSA